ncbi:hypothetical protein JHK82_048163 [Glycine max]|nr:hypothetical protein JHK82_048163 [Glycine max]
MLPTGKVTAFNLCHFFSKTDPHAFYDAMYFLSVHYDGKLDLDALTLRGGRE